MRTTAAMCLTLVGAATAANAQATIEFLPADYFVSDISADGTVACGNRDGSFETFRWTAATGPVLLGRATFPVLGVGAGSPDISYDGERISATILDDTGTLATMGVWDNSAGQWQVAVPPTGPGGNPCDASLASTWGLSGDGQTITGFYWGGCGAFPCTWSPMAGLTPLAVTPGRNARVNGSNFDGTIVFGWEAAAFGNWQPTVWRHGVKMQLATHDYSTGVEQSTPDGNILIGQSSDVATRRSAIWTWNGSSYDEMLLPNLPGTAVQFGQGGALGVTDDGSTVVGFNIYSFAPFALGDGWIWTAATGQIEAHDFVDSLGLVLPPGYDISAFSGISADGSTIFGSGLDGSLTGSSFIIRLTPPACFADLTTTGFCNNTPDGLIDLSDFSCYLSQWSTADPDADITLTGVCDAAAGGGDGVDLSDFSCYLSEWSLGCP